MKGFDIRSYLQDKGISYQESGKNVTRGWIELQCVFPFCGDKSAHLGVSPQMWFSCWKCGSSGPIKKLIMQIEETEDSRILNQIMRKYSLDSEIIGTEAIGRKDSGVLRLPQEADSNFNQDHYNYLISRRFDPEIIIPKYKLKVCHNVGKYKFRIIIPIIMDGQTVSFIGMDYTKRQKEKYLNASNEESMFPAKECVYNIDSVGDIAVVVEGVTDVWRGGDGFCGTLGTRWTTEQVAVLLWKKPKIAYIMFDGEEEAIRQAYKLANKLSGVIETVVVMELSDGDPDDIPDEEMTNFRKEVGL